MKDTTKELLEYIGTTDIPADFVAQQRLLISVLLSLNGDTEHASEIRAMVRRGEVNDALERLRVLMMSEELLKED